MAARECFAGAPGPAYLEIPRDILDREIDLSRAVIPEAGKYRASTKSLGDPADISGMQLRSRNHLLALDDHLLRRGFLIREYFDGNPGISDEWGYLSDDFSVFIHLLLLGKLASRC